MRFPITKPLSRLFRPAAAAGTAAPGPAPAADTTEDSLHKPPDDAALHGVADDPARLTAEFALIDDPDTILRLVTEGPTSRVRQLAAQRIDDPATLKLLVKQTREKDKSVYKIIRQKYDALRAEEARLAQIDSDVAATCAALERHAHRYYDALYEPALRQLEAPWRTLEALAPVELRERARVATERCRQIIAEHHRQVAEKAAQRDREAALQAERDAERARAAEELRLREEAAALAAAEEAKRHASEAQAHATRLAAEAHALRQLGGLLARANGALREGNSGRAAGLRRAIEQKLPSMPSLPASLAGQLQHLDEQLNRLKEWKDYAVAPKRAELIADMTALIGSSEEPQVLADRIRQLREDWKTISKGIVGDSAADWQRFNEAAVAAYQPCQEYFDAQARQRRDNLGKRKALLERLRSFESTQGGEAPDWRAIGIVLREAREEWRRWSPVDRAAGAAVQREFEASLGRLHSHLDAWHTANAQAKQALIVRAQALIAQPRGRDATDAVKRLQLEWKEIGAARRDQEQSLWNEFRKHCDAVFQMRQQAHTEHIAVLETNRQRALELCAQAEQAASQSGAALIEAAAQLQERRTEFESLGELPATDQRRLRERFARALERCRTSLDQQRARDRERSFVNLLECTRGIQAFGWAVAQGADDGEQQALKLAAEQFIAGVPLLPKGGPAALQGAWSQAHAAMAADTVAREQSLRMLCVRAEIIDDRVTPPEDQAARREYQVQRLVKHMGHPGDAGSDHWESLALEWARVGVAGDVRDALLERFLGGRHTPRPA